MPRRRDTGSVTLLYVLCLMLLGGFAVAGLVIGRQAFERRELQTEADAIALAAVYSVQQLGLPHKTAPALPKGTRNTRLPFTSKFYPVERRLNEHRTLVRVELEGTLDTKQTWFPQRFLKPRVEAWAQINEVEYGDVWPVVFFAIEATESMNWVLQGSNNKTAFSLVGDLIQQYAQNTLPVRNGVALFWTDMVGGNPTTEHWVPSPPPLPNDHNFVGIKNVLNNPPNPLAGLTNIASALKNTRNLLDQYQGDRYAVLVSDGEATLGPACGPKEGCHFDNLAGEAIPEAQQLRMAPQQGTTLVGLEILRSNWFVRQSNLMCASSGEFLAPNGGPANHFALPDVVSHDLHYVAFNATTVTDVIRRLAKTVCTFGPLDPAPDAPTDALRPRPAICFQRPQPCNPGLADPRQRVFVFLRYANGQEVRIDRVPNVDVAWDQPGFEYWEKDTCRRPPKSGTRCAYVILTLASCAALGVDNTRRLVIRWDDPMLVPPLKP